MMSRLMDEHDIFQQRLIMAKSGALPSAKIIRKAIRQYDRFYRYLTIDDDIEPEHARIATMLGKVLEDAQHGIVITWDTIKHIDQIIVTDRDMEKMMDVFEKL